MKNTIKSVHRKILIILGLIMTETVYAQFIDDAKLSLTAKNYYFDRDYINNVPYPTARDWAQGFIFNAKSGYTTGPVGVGLDILALAGFNLLGNHNNDNASSGLLPVNTKNERADTTGELRWTAKAKMNNLTPSCRYTSANVSCNFFKSCTAFPTKL